MPIQAIKNANIITMKKEKDIIENGAVVIEGNMIIDVGDQTIIDKYSIGKIIDARGGILMPGMINTHTHIPMVVFRSLADDIKNRLNRFIIPLEKELVNKELVKLGAYYGIFEMLLGGVTTFADMYFFEDEVAHAAKDMGIRAVLGETVQNTPTPNAKEPYGGLVYGEWFINKWKNDPLITPAVAPHAPYSNDTKHLIKSLQLAEKYDVPMMMHVAEMKYEFEKYQEEYGLSPVQYLDRIGVLNNRLIAAHLVWVTEEDLELLQEKNVGIAHNVGANSKGAKGVSPAVSMYRRGMRIGLGTDGPMSGNTLDIISQMGLAGKIHKLFNKDRSIFPASEIVEMATIGGARALNLDNVIGSIEVGKKADLVILETESVNMQPIYDYYSVVAYSANASNIEVVIVDGKILVENKKLINNNIKETQKQLKELKEAITNFATGLQCSI